MLNKLLAYVRRTISKATSAEEQTSDRLPLTGARGLPDWRGLLAKSTLWKSSLRNAESGPRVLIPTSVGGLSAATIFEGLLGVALTLRGAKVRFLLCDGVLPACLHVHLGKVSSPGLVVDYRLKSDVCPGCFARGNDVYQSTGLPISRYSEFLDDTERRDLKARSEALHLDELRAFKNGAHAIGEHALAGALRFYACGNLPETPEAQQVLRRYIEAAMITEWVIQRVNDRFAPHVAVFHHGIYVPQGIIGEVARGNGIRVANWQVAYRKQCFIFSHHESYHHTLIDEPIENWSSISWNETLERSLFDYLVSRRSGTNDWIWFHDQPQHDVSAILNEVGLDPNKPFIAMLTNVFWDAQLHFKANAFSDMLQWVIQTIEYFAGRPELQLAIRIHPAEVRGAIPSRQPMVDEIRKVFATLPANVFVIPPESQVSTYALCDLADSVIIYGTKTGVELTAFGTPVVVAGEAWIRNKGLTTDAQSREHYFSILEQLPYGKAMDAATVSQAKKYAFHFFFRRFVPVQCLRPSSNGVPFEIDIHALEALLPGVDPGLDVICDGILHGTDFIYPAERYLSTAP